MSVIHINHTVPIRAPFIPQRRTTSGLVSTFEFRFINLDLDLDLGCGFSVRGMVPSASDP